MRVGPSSVLLRRVWHRNKTIVVGFPAWRIAAAYPRRQLSKAPAPFARGALRLPVTLTGGSITGLARRTLLRISVCHPGAALEKIISILGHGNRRNFSISP